MITTLYILEEQCKIAKLFLFASILQNDCSMEMIQMHLLMLLTVASVTSVDCVQFTDIFQKHNSEWLLLLPREASDYNESNKLAF
jgi:hypothetical protein